MAEATSEKRRHTGIFFRFRKSRDGAAALEFAILAVPFLMLVFATFETFLAFAGEQLLGNAVTTMSRKIRTGEITFGLGKPTDMTESEFREAFCAEIAILHMCSSTEATTPDKLYLDVRQFASFADMPKEIPRQSSDKYADLDTSDFAFSPGGPETKNMVRAYYRWQIMTDLVRPYITNIHRAGQTIPTDYLIISTSAFESEKYE